MLIPKDHGNNWLIFFELELKDLISRFFLKERRTLYSNFSQMFGYHFNEYQENSK